MYVPDNYDQFEARERRAQQWMESLPVCAHCEQPIQQDDAVYIDGKWYCDDCLDSFLRKDIAS